MRRILSLVVLAVGVVASAASSPGLGGGVSGNSGTISSTLDAAGSEENEVKALLDAQIEIGDDGSIDLTTTFDGTSVAGVRIGLESLTTGEVTEVDVDDISVQPQVSVGIPAFEGCDGLTPCEEDLVVRFERLDDGEDSISFDWELDGSVSIVSDEEDPVVGTLTFTLQ